MTTEDRRVIPEGLEQLDKLFVPIIGPRTNMQVIKFLSRTDSTRTPRVGLLLEGKVRPVAARDARLADLLHAPSPMLAVQEAWDLAGVGEEFAVESVRLLAPIDRQEVWGAGVTYERSKVAREEESEHAATFYDRVYRADRPELFFKATPSRVAGPNEAVRVRFDSKWTVPEPELALVLSPEMRVVGYTIGNDVSARDIEGVNPLYLPQAKTYDASCSLGPAITLLEAMPPLSDIKVDLEIDRDGGTIFRDSTPLSRMARKLEDLVAWLARDNTFPDGVFLLTGTGVVPPDDFTLKNGDQIRITINGIGTLDNSVVQGPAR